MNNFKGNQCTSLQCNLKILLVAYHVFKHVFFMINDILILGPCEVILKNQWNKVEGLLVEISPTMAIGSVINLNVQSI